jgi:hypothetical protein
LVGCEPWERRHTSFKNVAVQSIVPKTVQIRNPGESGADDYYVVLVYGVSIFATTVYIFFDDGYRGHNRLETRVGTTRRDSLATTKDERNTRYVENNGSRDKTGR